MKENSTQSRRTALSQVGSIEGKGQGLGADPGRPGAVGDVEGGGVKGLGSDQHRRTPLIDTPQKRIVTHTAAPGFTIGERATLRDAIEADIHRTRKLGMMDFNRSRQSVRAAILALPFFDAAAVRRIAAAPLPGKAETISDLNEQLIFLSSDR